MTARSVTEADIEAEIYSEHYFTGEGAVHAQFDVQHRWNAGMDVLHDSVKRLTFCVLVLKSGFTVVGTSACIDEETFDIDVGRRIARKKAIDKCWELFGFALTQRLAESNDDMETLA
jgi:hypothetical protein